jgi:hypothetical protein
MAAAAGGVRADTSARRAAAARAAVAERSAAALPCKGAGGPPQSLETVSSGKASAPAGSCMSSQIRRWPPCCQAKPSFLTPSLPFLLLTKFPASHLPGSKRPRASPTSRSTLLANWQLLDRLFRAAAAFLEEGSLECRTHGKRLLWELRSAAPARPDWERLLSGLRPEALQRKVLEVLDAPGGPPPPPSRGRMGESSIGPGPVAAPTGSMQQTSERKQKPGPCLDCTVCCRTFLLSRSAGMTSGYHTLA